MKLLITTLIILAGLVLIGFTHARGDECYTPAQLKANVEAAHDRIVGYAFPDSDRMDLIIIVKGKTIVVAWAFKDGCFFGSMGLDTVTAPAAPTVKPPDAGA